MTPQEMATLAHAYKRTFGSPWGHAVLQDLAGECCAATSCRVPGQPQQTAENEAKREVWLYINQFLHLTHDQLVALARGNQQVISWATEGDPEE